MKTYIFFAFIIFPQVLYSQVLKGTVVNIETKNPIVGVNLIIQELNTKSQTDSTGNFRFSEIPVGRYSVVATKENYNDAYLFEILVGTGKEIDLTIPLKESIYLNEVVVSAPRGHTINDMATVSARSFTVEQTQRYAAAWGDPARMALSFAGTSNVDDETNEIVIRGNSPKGLLWKIDGIEVPNPNHFATMGSSGGAISALSSKVLANSDFFTGAFPAEYGNALSGVFDIHLKKGNNEKQETSVDIGTKGLEMSTEGPFSKKSKASYIVNYRYSTLKILKSIGWDLSKNATPNFQDAIFKVFVPIRKSSISIWGLGGKSSSDYDNNIYNQQIDNSNMYSSGLNLTNHLNEKTNLENIISFSGNQMNNSTSSRSMEYEASQTVKNQTNFIRYSSQYTQKIGVVHYLKLGFIFTNSTYKLINENQFVVNNTPSNDIKVSNSGKSQYYQTYFQWKSYITPILSLNYGMHFSYFALNNKKTIEPRLGGRLQLTSKSLINIGIGLHSRLDPINIYLFQVLDTIQNKYVLPNKNLEIPKSIHYVINYEYRLGNNWSFITEAYLQKLYDIGVGNSLTDTEINRYSTLNDLDASTLNALVSKGKGTNYGIELTIEKKIKRGIYFISTTSINKSLYKTIDGATYTAKFSNDHVQNLLGGKEWRIGRKRNDLFALNIRTTWAGGVRIIPIDLEKSRKNGYQINDYSRIYNQKQLADFFRTDLRLSYVKNMKNSAMTMSIDINNITNHQNPLDEYYNIGTKTIETIYQLGMIPVFSLKIDF